MPQILPEILLRIPGGTWPLGQGLPVGTGRCDSLNLDRELVAASLPGQVRGKTGFSIGTASVAVAQPRDRQFTPWSPSLDRLVDAGTEAELVAWDERTGTETPLGRWLVAKPAGSLKSSQIAVELDESQARGRDLPNRLPAVAGPVDPVWIVDQFARQMGYLSTPVPSGFGYTMPLCGGLDSHVTTGLTVAPTAGAGAVWSVDTGVPGLASATVLPRWNVISNFPLTFAVNYTGTVTFRLSEYAPDQGIDVELGPGTIRARFNGGAWSTAQPFTAGMDPNWPTRVQVLVTRSGTTLTIRARSSATGALSTAINLTATIETLFSVGVVALDGGISGLALVPAADDAGLWAAPSATMSLLDGRVSAPWVPSELKVWPAIQHVCDSWGGIAVKSNDDHLRVLNRHEAAGSNRPKTVIDVDRLAEDIRWEVAADDFADRLETTWYPPTWPDEFTDPSEWTVDRLHVPAGSTVAVDVDLGGYVRRLLPFLNVADPDLQIDSNSEWDANTAADGFGTPVVAGITVSVEHQSPARARVTVKNTSSVDVWMVADGGDGATGLILRGVGKATQEDAATITRGAAEIDAKHPLEIDLGRTVQSRADADALTSYLWERVNRRRFRVNGVRLPLDWSRDLADILLLDHARSGLSLNALVTGIHIDPGTPGMTVDLAALPPIWSDFDAAWAGATGDDFDAAWAGLSGVAFDNDPLKTEA